MPSDKNNQTLADYVALAFSPALIMALVASLVFFLLEISYQGQYQGRLQWILFFFVFGAVLVARLSMSDLAPRAKLYGPVLAGLTWLGMQIFLKYQDESPVAPLAWLINLFLVCVVWWCAHRLTWDCTHVDDDVEPNAEGLLQSTGLDRYVEGGVRLRQRKDEEETAEGGKDDKKLSWWERLQRYREERRKRRPLGVWVVYFSLAALPLFGLGQALIPADTTEGLERRRYTFWLMTIYVGSGLGLLLTTCFLGLRRYLRQRNLRMPKTMTSTWLTVGGTMIALLLIAGAFLPRPQSEYSVSNFRGAGSEKRDASKVAFKGDTPSKGDSQSGAEKQGEKGEKGNGPDGQKGEKSSGSGKDGKGQGKDGQGKDGSGQNKDGSGQSKDSQQNKDGSSQNKDRGGSDKKDGKQGDSSSKSDQQGKDGKDGKDGKESRSGSGSSSTASASLSKLHSVVSRIAPVLKWIVFGVLAAIVVFLVLRNGLQFLANFSDWARGLLEALSNFWASLFGGGQKEGEGGEVTEAAERVVPPAPFSSFRNPFMGEVERMTPAELVQYTFAALQAWAREHDLERHPGETALEFSERVGQEVPALDAELRRVTALYARATYSQGSLPAGTADTLRSFWEQLETLMPQAA
jgi:hypothetical protein